MSLQKPFRVGICVGYGTDIFTLAFVIFKPNGDVILSQHYGDYQRLESGTKFDPHVTYHADGTYHVAHYKRNPVDKGYAVDQKRQPLSSAFKGHETLLHQGFGRKHAQALGQRCSGYDYVVTVNADDIHPTSASFEVTLIEPNTDPVIPQDQAHPVVLAIGLVKDTFPWCLTTVRTFAC